MEDAFGRLIVAPHINPEFLVSGVASSTGTADTAVIAAQGAGRRIYVTSITVVNDGGASAIRVDIKDGTTVIWRAMVLANTAHTINFSTPLRLTANTALNMASSAIITTAYFSAAGFVLPG